MRIKEGFVLRKMLGENIVVGEGLSQVNFNKMVSMNSTAAYLWESVAGMDFTADTLKELLLKEYDVDEETAAKDAAAIAEKWIEVGIVE